jgi:hypothetical protein
MARVASLVLRNYSRLMEEQAGWPGFRRRAIVDQQLWYLGRDIGAQSGNGLLAYGFQRRRSPSGSGSTAYLLPISAFSPDLSGMLVCWGFGLYAGSIDEPAAADTMVPRTPIGPARTLWAGACLERFGNAPRLVRCALSPTLHQVADLPRMVVPRTADERAFADATVREIARAFAAYERWAIATLGEAHRHAALESAPRHKRHRFKTEPELSGSWEQLATGRYTANVTSTS